jgi:hypothetical protein
MLEEDDAFTLDSGTGTDGSEHCEWDSHQLKQIDYEDEFKDTELEDLVKSEGPQEILQVILQEQVDGVMPHFSKGTNGKDGCNGKSI